MQRPEHALSLEVHAKTLKAVRRRFRGTRHISTVEDAVQEAFMVWLSREPDAARAADVHAFWLIKLASAYILNKTRGYSSRAVRPIASWALSDWGSAEGDAENTEVRETGRLEGAVHRFRAAHPHMDPLPESEDAEGEVVRTLDAMRVMQGGGWRSAIDWLLLMGWSQIQIAGELGVSRAAVSQWVLGFYEPQPDRQDALVALRASGRLPPGVGGGA